MFRFNEAIQSNEHEVNLKKHEFSMNHRAKAFACFIFSLNLKARHVKPLPALLNLP